MHEFLMYIDSNSTILLRNWCFYWALPARPLDFIEILTSLTIRALDFNRLLLDSDRLLLKHQFLRNIVELLSTPNIRNSCICGLYISMKFIYLCICGLMHLRPLFMLYIHAFTASCICGLHGIHVFAACICGLHRIQAFAASIYL
ncbi:hypothetical protein BGX38DRAFT_399848 [Terfezia claveryi]|nr:hypothetical protein BGX38DRAFT_399848 [Terfezia claveryi]